MPKARSPRNRTLTLTDEDRERLLPRLNGQGPNCTLLGDCRSIIPELPCPFADLIFLDPPYNLSRKFGKTWFRSRSIDAYTEWFSDIMDTVLPSLKPTGTIYICGDWRTSASIFPVIAERLIVRNRITWEREKGRGAKTNWKNSSEDIWFCTASDDYTFNVDDVKMRRRVIAPYRSKGKPKDWQETEEGNFRDTYPSNLWSDITIPFWSMPENTDHPTQKSEKLLAKLILASTHPWDTVFDPFLGSGTTSVVAKKLGRCYVGIEREEEYALLAEKRLELCGVNSRIQGYEDGVFWQRNTGG